LTRPGHGWVVEQADGVQVDAQMSGRDQAAAGRSNVREPSEQSAAGGGGRGPAAEAAPASSLPARLRAVYAERVGASEQALMLSWAAFSATFGTARGITHWLRRRDSSSGGSGGIVIGGKHFHHYNLGILLLTTVGGVAVHGQEHRRSHPVVAAAYGVGAALVVDELALLLDLSDVYWASEGRTSVDAAVGVIGVGGLVLAAVPFWSGAAKEVVRTRESS